jgi:hypothetical protein
MALRDFLRGMSGARGAAAPGRLVALTATRDDDWVLGLSLRASLSFCDAVVLTDHRSGPRTAGLVREIQAEFPDGEISVRRDESTEWMEADVRQEMLERGRALGGTHFVIVDADELPTANLLPRLRALALGCAPGEGVALPMISPYHCSERFRWDGKWGADNRIPWAFGDAPPLYWKAPGGYQLHWRMPHGLPRSPLAFRGHASGGLFHLQFASLARLRAKALWYKMSETLRYPGKRTPAELNRMYDWTLVEAARMRLLPVPDEWWAAYRERGWLGQLRLDEPAWQLGEIRELLSRHGRAPFAGLEFHGVA